MDDREEVGIPFVGQNGFYPRWAKGSGRWVFQRTLVCVGGPLGLGELATMNVPVAHQVIVWSPPARGVGHWFGTAALQRERDSALGELEGLPLRCYGNNCRAARKQGFAKSAVVERGVYPDKWYLACPVCRGQFGPDLDRVCVEVIVSRWKHSGKPALDNPAAGADWRSAPEVVDVPRWIERSDPSPLELAYVGQQLWATMREMLVACAGE
jgi:hypothetical protein